MKRIIWLENAFPCHFFFIYNNVCTLTAHSPRRSLPPALFWHKHPACFRFYSRMRIESSVYTLCVCVCAVDHRVWAVQKHFSLAILVLLCLPTFPPYITLKCVSVLCVCVCVTKYFGHRVIWRSLGDVLASGGWGSKWASCFKTWLSARPLHNTHQHIYEHVHKMESTTIFGCRNPAFATTAIPHLCAPIYLLLRTYNM